MEYPLKIPASGICHILSTPESQLSSIDLAIKRLLQSMYSASELEALKEHACLTTTLGPIDVGTVSKPRRL